MLQFCGSCYRPPAAEWLKVPGIGYALVFYSTAVQVWQGHSLKDGARPVPQHLAEITPPTLIIWGGDDPVFPADDGTQLAQTMPNATLKTLPGVGYIPHEEAHEEVGALLQE